MAPTQEEIARWKALAEAATAGPWEADTHGISGGSISCEKPCGRRQVAASIGQAAMFDERADTGEVLRANAAFIAAARDAVPRLIAEVERLREREAIAQRMSNLCFNLSQSECSFEERHRIEMRDLYRQWDDHLIAKGKP